VKREREREVTGTRKTAWTAGCEVGSGLCQLSADDVFGTEVKWNLCMIWGLHGDDYEECRLLGCYAV
jgi:hypothetical protein